MRPNEKIVGFACVLAAAAFAAGCVPALDYGSVPPEPEYTTKITTTTAGTTKRKPFTTHSHKERTISWAEYSGTRARSTTTGKTGTGTSTTGTYTGTYTGTGSGITDTGSGYDPEHSSSHTTDMPQTVTTTVHSDEASDDPGKQTTVPPVDPPQTDSPQTAPPQTEPPVAQPEDGE